MENRDIRRDKIRGCLLGGAAGDALGYPVEFLDEREIFSRYGDEGIYEYKLDGRSRKALVSDDTQMTLFTADGILTGDTRDHRRGVRTRPRTYVAMAYRDWLRTQQVSYEEGQKAAWGYTKECISWLCGVPELYSQRVPGLTCLSAMDERGKAGSYVEDYIRSPLNDSKGSGGIMRTAPLALAYNTDIKELDMEAAQIAAITHSHSLGYMPAAVVTHIINRIVFPDRPRTLKEIVLEARDTAAEIFHGDGNLKALTDIIDLAVKLSENRRQDLNNIRDIGRGWVGEETLGIALYCALRYQNNFSGGIITAVNHRGDSDTTGAVAGNILGALAGYEAIDEKWKRDLELKEVILEIADDLSQGCGTGGDSHYEDPRWAEKYVVDGL